MPSTSEKPHSLLPRNSANQVIGGGSRLKPSHCFGPDRLDSLDRWRGQRHLASTTASLTAQAATHLLATAQGAYLKIEGGNIELHGKRPTAPPSPAP